MPIFSNDLMFIIDFIQLFLKDSPNAETIESLKKISTEEIFNEDIVDILKYLQSKPAEIIAEELNFDYVKLFTHPRDFKTFPIASYHVSENKTLVSKITEDIKNEYLDENFILSKKFNYKEDHLVAMLEFIKHIENKDKIEIFFNKYIEPWIAKFSDAIGENADTLVYKKISCILKYFRNSLTNY